jgi:hypothetical protein
LKTRVYMSMIGNTNHKLQFVKLQITICNTCNIQKSRPGVEPATSRIWQYRQH